jgi:hypothetical protein
MTSRAWAYAGDRRDLYPWTLIVAFVAFSAWGNSLHAPAGGTTLRLVAATPPLAAALSWHLLVLPSFGESAWRRWLARAVAAAVFGYTMWGSWSSLTALGDRAALPHPTVLPVGVDGLVFVAAVAVWSRAGRRVETQVETATEPLGDAPGETVYEAQDETPAEHHAALTVVHGETPDETETETAARPPVRSRRDGKVRCDCGERGCSRWVSRATLHRHRAKAEQRRAEAEA